MPSTWFKRRNNCFSLLENVAKVLSGNFRWWVKLFICFHFSPNFELILVHQFSLEISSCALGNLQKVLNKEKLNFFVCHKMIYVHWYHLTLTSSTWMSEFSLLPSVNGKKSQKRNFQLCCSVKREKQIENLLRTTTSSEKLWLLKVGNGSNQSPVKHERVKGRMNWIQIAQIAKPLTLITRGKYTTTIAGDEWRRKFLPTLTLILHVASFQRCQWQ